MPPQVTARSLSWVLVLLCFAGAVAGCGSSPAAMPGCALPDGAGLPAKDAAPGADMASASDAGMALDTGMAADTGMASDAGMRSDGPAGHDAVGPDFGTPVPPANPGMRIGTNLWGLEWGIWNDVFVPGVDFSTTTNPWRQPFLDEISHYGVIRFMDFQKVNDSTERRWSDRTQKIHPASLQIRLAYEWMIDLSNRTHADMWISVPHLADEDYVNQLATLIKSSLDPALKVYVEWSNETWNPEFAQTQYAYDQGNALMLDPDPWAAAFRYQVYAAIRLFGQFEKVFGKNSPRLVKVVGGAVDNTWITQHHLAALRDARVNPEAITADAYGIAPYFGDGLTWNTVDPMTELSASITELAATAHKQFDLVSKAGLQLIAYEGGQHVLANAEVINKRPEMYQLYTSYLDALAPSLHLFLHYCHNGDWNDDRAWGAEAFVGQPLDQAHKLRALYDWMNGHKPRP